MMCFPRVNLKIKLTLIKLKLESFNPKNLKDFLHSFIPFPWIPSPN